MVATIALLTDFGHQDVYVGVMKGVIASICPEAKLIDLSHTVPPQNIAAARFNLLNAYPYMPQGTVYLVVVDPGVGTRRRAIAIQTPQGYLVGPDNGVLSGVLAQENEIAAVSLTHNRYWRSPVPSATFHGRDIFAPVAAHLASGIDLGQLGEILDPASLVQIPIPQPEITDQHGRGHIQYIDHFGNLITTIAEEMMRQQTWMVSVGQAQIPMGQTYGDVAVGESVALIGSHGWLEIAVNGGSAREQFGVNVGDEIRLAIAR